MNRIRGSVIEEHEILNFKKAWLDSIFWPIRASNSIVLSSQVTKLYEQKIFQTNMSWWSCQFSMKCQNHLLQSTVIQKHPFSILTFYLYHIYNTRYLRSPYRFKHENFWHFNITFFFAHLQPYLIRKKQLFSQDTKSKFWILTNFLTLQIVLVKIDQQLGTCKKNSGNFETFDE